jgi:hypothetical protein
MMKEEQPLPDGQTMRGIREGAEQKLPLGGEVKEPPNISSGIEDVGIEAGEIMERLTKKIREALKSLINNNGLTSDSLGPALQEIADHCTNQDQYLQIIESGKEYLATLVCEMKTKKSRGQVEERLERIEWVQNLLKQMAEQIAKEVKPEE